MHLEIEMYKEAVIGKIVFTIIFYYVNKTLLELSFLFSSERKMIKRLVEFFWKYLTI